MMIAPLPHNEAERLDALRRYGILDTPPESDFDNLAQLPSQIFGTPMAMVSLIDGSLSSSPILWTGLRTTVK